MRTFRGGLVGEGGGSGGEGSWDAVVARRPAGSEWLHYESGGGSTRPTPSNVSRSDRKAAWGGPRARQGGEVGARGKGGGNVSAADSLPHPSVSPGPPPARLPAPPLTGVVLLNPCRCSTTKVEYALQGMSSIIEIPRPASANRTVCATSPRPARPGAARATAPQSQGRAPGGHGWWWGVGSGVGGWGLGGEEAWRRGGALEPGQRAWGTWGWGSVWRGSWGCGVWRGCVGVGERVCTREVVARLGLHVHQLGWGMMRGVVVERWVGRWGLGWERGLGLFT